MMEADHFDYQLPDSLIANYPQENRDDSRLLVVGSGNDNFTNLVFSQVGECLRQGDLLVLNNTRVVPARLRASKPTGGKVEIMLERIISHDEALVQCRASKKLRNGQLLNVTQDVQLSIISREGDFSRIKLMTSGNFNELFNRYGNIPLPPYIDRPAESIDEQRYQTVYASDEGAVAAPTAGLHFTRSLLDELVKVGIEIVEITLHVGAGTFKPIRQPIEQHQMHSERYVISSQAACAINRARDRGDRIVAVGTTTVRALESASLDGEIASRQGETRLFIKSGFKFQVVDAMITNFHLPRSTLLMMVCAFGGYRRVMRAYRYACQHKYRFYSYGDAMYITRK